MRKRKAIRLGRHGAVEVLFTRDGRTVYASQMETASVWEIDRRSFRVRRQLATKGNWSKVMALSPDERTLYVATGCPATSPRSTSPRARSGGC